MTKNRKSFRRTLIFRTKDQSIWIVFVRKYGKMTKPAAAKRAVLDKIVVEFSYIL